MKKEKKEKEKEKEKEKGFPVESKSNWK